MANFNIGDRAAVLVGKTEVAVVIIRKMDNDMYAVRYASGTDTMTTSADKLLSPKEPYFAVRGSVYTTSVHHPGEQGEIVETGHGPDKQRFFFIQFQDGKREWLSANDVFIKD
jgi:hypothetical protein